MDPEEEWEAEQARIDQERENAFAAEMWEREIQEEDWRIEYEFGRAEEVFAEGSIYNNPDWVHWLYFGEDRGGR